MDRQAFVAWAAVALWALSALTTPALKRKWGWPGLRVGLSVTILLHAFAACSALAAMHPPSTLAGVVIGIAAGGWLAEYVGVRTSLLFGPYAYTTRLQPQWGGVPALVTVAYAGVVVTSWGIADMAVRGRRGPEFVAVSAAAATAWDLFLDPLLVHWDLWVWKRKGGYFGIPWRNFLGWFVVMSALTAALQPGPIDPRPLAVVYTAAWGMVIAAIIPAGSLRGPAIVGGIVMGAVVVSAWLPRLW